MKAPIVVTADDVDVFESITAAERYLEATDVRRGGLEIFDCEGRVFTATVMRRFLGEAVRLVPEPGTTVGADRVRQSLVSFLAPIEELDVHSYDGLSLHDLGERALKYQTR